MNKLLSLIFVSMLLVTLACSPQVKSTPTPPPTPALPASPAVTPGREDLALQKLVEAAKKEGKVTLYTFNFIGDAGIAIQSAFTVRYGIKIDAISGRGAEFTERLKTEARTKNQTGDYTEGSPLHLINMKKAGLTTTLADLPVLQEKDVWKLDIGYLDQDKHLLAYSPIFQWPLVNTKLVKPEDEPKSWLDLLQPRWKGKILFADPVIASNAYMAFQPLVKGGMITSDYLDKLGAQDLLQVIGPTQGVEALSRGEAPIFLFTAASTATNAVRAGAPIKIIDLKEGMSAQANLMAVVKDSPHPNAAKLFANWLLSKEGQSVQAKARGADGVRKDVPSGFPPALALDPVRPVLTTSDDLETQGKMFQDKVYLPLLKKK